MIKVFVSSTRKDLDADCRPAVLKAFRLPTVESLAISMEDWSIEYHPAVEVCEAKIGESSHYIGIFGYFRGWVPPGHETSITELEFTWARTGKKRMVIFLPDMTQPENQPFAQELEARARAHQTQEELEAQRAFLDRVRDGGTLEFFDSALDLGMRTQQRLYLWSNPLLSQPAGPATPASRATRPRDDDLMELGRVEQVADFESTLQRLAVPGIRDAACFLVHGPPAFGQDRLIARLGRILERDAFSPPRPCVVGCGPLWRQRGLPSLLRALGREIEAGWEPASIQALAERLEMLLALSDVVLQISRLQHFEGGVAGFAAAFWQPLLAALPASTPCRLLCLATHEGAAGEAATWQSHRQDPAAAPDAARLVVLPVLRSFDAGEVTQFVRRYLPAGDVEPMTEALLADTGGNPLLLYRVLLDDSTWQS
jgi:hypothetical protein